MIRKLEEDRYENRLHAGKFLMSTLDICVIWLGELKDVSLIEMWWGNYRGEVNEIGEAHGEGTFIDEEGD